MLRSCLPVFSIILAPAERRSLKILRWFYRFADVQFVPNPDLQSMLSEWARKHCYLMRRGIDTKLFSPAKRTRAGSGELVIGYVRRLSPEKSVRQLVHLERKLIYAGLRNYRFVIVGDGGERAYLAREMRRRHFPELSSVRGCRGLTRIWTSSCSRQKPIPSGTSSWRRWRRACRRSSPLLVVRNMSSKMALAAW